MLQTTAPNQHVTLLMLHCPEISHFSSFFCPCLGYHFLRLGQSSLPQWRRHDPWPLWSGTSLSPCPSASLSGAAWWLWWLSVQDTHSSAEISEHGPLLSLVSLFACVPLSTLQLHLSCKRSWCFHHIHLLPHRCWNGSGQQCLGSLDLASQLHGALVGPCFSDI